MVNLLPAAVSPPPDRIPTPNTTDLALPPSIAQQIVFKFAQAYPTTQSSTATMEIPPAITEAVHRLVEIIRQLRSTEARPEPGLEEPGLEDAEARSTQPLSPEALVPYVQEEAEDVLAALQAHLSQSDPADSLPSRPPAYLWLKNLAPWLLWGVGRSSYDMMQLMEGQVGWLKAGEQGSEANQQPGILRLIALLRLQTATSTIDLDLATYQPVTSPLSPEAIVQWQKTGLEQPAKSVSTWLKAMQQQVQILSPELRPFLQGIPIDLLIPQQSWETGTLQLQLAFEFLPTGAIEFPASDIHSPSSSNFAASGACPSREFMAPRLKVTQTAWLESYTQTLHHQQFLTLLHQFPALYRLNDPATPPSLSMLVAAADVFAQQLQIDPLLTSRGFFQQDLSLSDLTSQLLWTLMHSAYEVMQWVSGSWVSLVQPQAPYQMGTLRFVVCLQLSTSTQNWRVDLATGQPLVGAAQLLSPQAIVQSPDHEWCHQPQRLEHLSRQIWQHLDRGTPELRQLQQGVMIELATEEGWHPARLQLVAAFEFVSSEFVLSEFVAP